MKLCVLIPTMNQTDFSKIYSMNIKCDAVIANQCNKNEIKEKNINDNRVKLISTNGRGLSNNRNIAFEHCYTDCELVLFADEDLVFNDDYVDIILSEFKSHPEAQAINFNLYNISTSRKTSCPKILKWKKATRKNISSFGVCGLVIKKNVLEYYNVRFNTCFGSGKENYCGEDTIFIQDLLKKKIKIYFSPKEIAGIDQTISSWFEGYNKKYFMVTGRVFATIYPRIAKLLAIRSSIRFYKRKSTKMKFKDIFKSYLIGINDIKKRKINFK